MKNKHTEELVNKDYFREWLRLESKINIPALCLWFALEFIHILLFWYFDVNFAWHENSPFDSVEDGCVKQGNSTSCTQEMYGFLSNLCSIWLSYIAMGILLLLNGIGWIAEIKAWRIMNKAFKGLAYTFAGRKEHLVHSFTDYVFVQFSKVGLFLNVVLRFPGKILWHSFSHVPITSRSISL